MSLRRYPVYGHSGVEWLGQVPKHWSISRLRSQMRLLTEKTNRRNNALGLENIEGWSGRLIGTDSEFEGNGIAFRQGDILFGKLRPYLAKVHLAETDGEAVGDFHVLRPAATLHGRFAQYQMLNRSFVEVVAGTTFGSKMPRANWESLGAMPFAVPSPNEQAAIATFLDRETAKIDALIAEQEKLIALLAEMRLAIISHSVTRGLDAKVPALDFDLAGMKRVPRHWTVCSIRRILVRVEQGWSLDCLARSAEGEEWGVLKAGCVNGGKFNSSENKALPEALEPDPSIEVMNGDVLMSRASGSAQLVGATAYISNPPPRLMLSDKTFRLRLRPTMLPQFFALTLGAKYMRSQIEQAISGASGLANNLPQSSLKSFAIAVPPPVEQQQIVEAVESETARLEVLLIEAERAITLLKERRGALISAAVTGQIDVRDVVTQHAAEEEFAA